MREAGATETKTNSGKPIKERERHYGLSNHCGYGTVRYGGMGRVPCKGLETEMSEPVVIGKIRKANQNRKKF